MRYFVFIDFCFYRESPCFAIQRLEDERNPAGRDAYENCIWVGNFISFMENYLIPLSLEKLFS